MQHFTRRIQIQLKPNQIQNQLKPNQMQIQIKLNITKQSQLKQSTIPIAPGANYGE
jgi:hypothetical protein